jgi:hypothetical protein
MDFSPMRPDEWAQTNRARWQYFLRIRSAYQQGVQDAEDEYQARQDLKRELDAEG